MVYICWRITVLIKLLEGLNACTDEETTLSDTSMGMYGEVVVEEVGLKRLMYDIVLISNSLVGLQKYLNAVKSFL